MSMLPAGGEGCAREEARVSTGQVGSPGDLLFHGFVTPRICYSTYLLYSGEIPPPGGGLPGGLPGCGRRLRGGFAQVFGGQKKPQNFKRKKKNSSYTTIPRNLVLLLRQNPGWGVAGAAPSS